MGPSPLANKFHNGSETPGRPPLRLLGFVVLLGAVLAWWGTRDDRHLFGESPRKPVGATALCLPANIQFGMVARGSQIQQRQCAGCHEKAAPSSAPSYREIVTFYRREFPTSADNQDLRSRLTSAVTHPRPGWGNFAPGPSESGLSLDDRIALANWILNSFDRDKNTGEGVGK